MTVHTNRIYLLQPLTLDGLIETRVAKIEASNNDTESSTAYIRPWYVVDLNLEIELV